MYFYFIKKKYWMVILVSNELRFSDIVRESKLWEHFYKKNPNNILMQKFIKNMKNATPEEIESMKYYGYKLDDAMYDVLNKSIDVNGKQAEEITFFLLNHLNLIHEINEEFLDFLILLCERGLPPYGKEDRWRNDNYSVKVGGIITWLDVLQSENPDFFKKNPGIVPLAKKYSQILYDILVANKEKIIGGKFNVL